MFGRGTIKTQTAMRGPQGDPGKQSLALSRCTAETPLGWALGQSLPVVPAALPALQRPGHQAGKASGAPFPASTAAAPAFLALDPPNYS